MDIEAFAELVEEAIGSLPEEFLDRLENVQVDVEEWPTREDLEKTGLGSRDRYALLGLYHGVPLTDRSIYYTAFPDRITIYQKPIEALCGQDEDAIMRQVQHTVVHEIAHYYGIDDDRLDELGAY